MDYIYTYYGTFVISSKSTWLNTAKSHSFNFQKVMTPQIFPYYTLPCLSLKNYKFIRHVLLLRISIPGLVVTCITSMYYNSAFARFQHCEHCPCVEWDWKVSLCYTTPWLYSTFIFLFLISWCKEFIGLVIEFCLENMCLTLEKKDRIFSYFYHMQFNLVIRFLYIPLQKNSIRIHILNNSAGNLPNKRTKNGPSFETRRQPLKQKVWIKERLAYHPGTTTLMFLWRGEQNYIVSGFKFTTVIPLDSLHSHPPQKYHLLAW